MERASAINEQDRRDYNAAIGLIERAICSEDKKLAQEAWEEGLILAGVCYSRNDQRDDFNYLLGYIYYHAVEKTDETRRNAENFLRRATLLNSEHSLARYYLACLLFDCERYPESLRELNAVPETIFVESGQAWRSLKVVELRLCCSLYITREIKSQLEAMRKLLDIYRGFHDPLLAPMPLELAECLEFNLRRVVDDYTLVELCRLCFDVFSLLSATDIVESRWPLVYQAATKPT